MTKKIIHRAENRGKADHGWLLAHHSFSFASFYDPEKMNFGALRVINDDQISGGGGFGTHPHKDMEIITIPLEGGLEHKDSMGHGKVVTAGEVQVMSAGTGVSHSEFNASSVDPVKLFQVWIFPKTAGIAPSYDQKSFDTEKRKGKFQLLVSNDEREGSLKINQDAFISRVDLKDGESIDYEFYDSKNLLYLMVVEGEVEVEGETLKARDGIGLEKASSYQILSKSNSSILAFEVPEV